ncbi:MAG: toll/interleukin-1 receptor domain-containing protein [Clostridiales bacterium]|nr:toll/interleukin-1 receptor domain-containing protein [Clostridiales bacterium]
MKTQIEPYEGAKPYVFISYSHEDSKQVLPIIKKLQSEGYRVWFDNGIVSGKKWREVIAQHIRGSGYFVAFISENYSKSEMCKNEFFLAQEYSKRWLPIYLEKNRITRRISPVFLSYPGDTLVFLSGSGRFL